MYLLTLMCIGNTDTASLVTALNSNYLYSSFLSKLTPYLPPSSPNIFKWEYGANGQWHLHLFLPFLDHVPPKSLLTSLWFDTLNELVPLTVINPLTRLSRPLPKLSDDDIQSYMVHCDPFILLAKRHDHYYLSKVNKTPLRTTEEFGTIKVENEFGYRL